MVTKTMATILPEAATATLQKRKAKMASSSTATSPPPGFRFYPTEEELVGFYLPKKLENTRNDIDRVIPVLDVYRFEPWQLPEMSGEPCIRDSEQWFFFCRRQSRESQGGRTARSTPVGYWKATGSKSHVFSSHNNRAIGEKRTMVFYKGRAPNGTKTNWKMNEYTALEDGATATTTTTTASATPRRRDFSLCRVYVKSGCVRAFDRRPSASTRSSSAPPGMQSSRDDEEEEGGGGHGAFGGDVDMRLLEEINWDYFLENI